MKKSNLAKKTNSISAQGSEVSYALHSLGWKAFQNLCATVMSEVFGQTIQTFFDAQDGGRDGAFHGTWKPQKGEILEGTFTAQCKFTAKPDTHINLSDLKEEIAKAKRLAAKGFADNYILFTNARLKGISDEKIKQAFESIPGIKHFIAYGSERISLIIQESPRLRMLVPRVYGLGDLSQIMDQRAYDQATEILSALGDDLGKFIITDAYQKSAQALVEHGFVLLLGEPACGKSTIAAALAVGALDEWGCSTIKICKPDEFIQHSNPHEKQFFWVDDAFGPTQLDASSAIDWSRVFPHIHAAIHRGAKVLFTSRDYIYKSAKRYLKETALPVIKESQVVIHVENLSKDEREQILYNHIRMGTQATEFRKKIKKFLPSIAAQPRFSPEIARRLGSPIFTKTIPISEGGLNNFVENQSELLTEVINTLDDGARSALALVFMRAGTVESPVQISKDEEQVIARLGGSNSQVLESLGSLNGSLLIKTLENGIHTCHFKHPTVRDAFATVVSEDLELMDIYLTGAPLDTLLSEISCGDASVRGAKVIVPENRYDDVMSRLDELNTQNWREKSALHRFLSYRCDKSFLERFISGRKGFVERLKVEENFFFGSDIDLLVRLHEFDQLPEPKRLEIVLDLKRLAVETPDSSFLRDDIRALLDIQELQEILEHVRTNLLSNFDECLDAWKSNYDNEYDPEVYMDDLISTLNDYKEEFKNDRNASTLIAEALTRIDIVIEELRSEIPDEPENEDQLSTSSASSPQDHERSIFDDVDA